LNSYRGDEKKISQREPCDESELNALSDEEEVGIKNSPLKSMPTSLCAASSKDHVHSHSYMAKAHEQFMSQNNIENGGISVYSKDSPVSVKSKVQRGDKPPR
jgi:hypothetical protein